MARSPYPNRPANATTVVQLARVAKISAFELDLTQDAVPGLEPDLVTLVKRLVHAMDLLEVSNNAQWVINVAALTRQPFRMLFQRSASDRLRARYSMYGQSRTILLLLQTELDALV